MVLRFAVFVCFQSLIPVFVGTQACTYMAHHLAHKKENKSHSNAAIITRSQQDILLLWVGKKVGQRIATGVFTYMHPANTIQKSCCPRLKKSSTLFLIRRQVTHDKITTLQNFS